MNLDIIKCIESGAKFMAMLPLNLLSDKVKGDYIIRTEAAWDEEKTDILHRANWLYEQISVDPEKFLGKFPSMIGSMYVGQWAIYTCSMLVAALHNIIRLYPETKAKAITKMERAIDLALTPSMRRFDSDDWKEDPLEGLHGTKGHFTYLTTIGWMIGEFKIAGGGSKYDGIYNAVCDGINHRMRQSKDMNVVSFRNNIVFISDMVLACVVLKQHSRLCGSPYADTASLWLSSAKKDLIHKSTGLLVAEKRYRWNPRVRGSYTALTNYYLTLLDDIDFAKDQYERMKKVFSKLEPYSGLKEYMRQGSGFQFDKNAGPMLYGLSTSGTALAIGTATFFQDWEYRNRILHTAEVLGQTTNSANTSHYRLAELAPVGEAFVLAMRTNIQKKSSYLFRMGLLYKGLNKTK